MTQRQIDIHVPTLARVEGEGALHVRVSDGEIDDLRLEIYEPPRFFEALLRGRSHLEPVDITARICGICPVAYQISAAQAIERALGIALDRHIVDLRRLLYCGEWIESHVLHIGLLHAPDFLGVPSGLDLATTHRGLVELVLELKRFGNDVMEAIGGRPIHPVNVCVGGLHHVPRAVELESVRDRVTWALEAAEQLVRWTAGFDFPDVLVDHELVSLGGTGAYPIDHGHLVSDRGLDLDLDDPDFDRRYTEEFVELHVGHSTALHCRRSDGRQYLTGPLARWANNHGFLPTPIRELAADVGVGPVERNPFRSIVVRSLETLFAVSEAQRLLAAIDTTSAAATRAFVDADPVASAAWGATEAPRGVLLHRYEIDADGTIVDALIVPPTAQNQAAIESDVRTVVAGALAGDPDLNGDTSRLRHRCEMAIRNHDPCISCATHFLRLDVQGGSA